MPAPPLLNVRNLGLKKDQRWLFRNLEFSIPREAFIAITGPSGVGKTSLLSLLAQSQAPTEGSLSLPSLRKTQVGVIYQDLQLTNGASVWTNALSGSLGRHGEFATLFGFPREEKDKCHHLLKRFGLGEKTTQWASTLSRGERQRLAICRALLSAPTLLLADEPVASLDASWAQKTLAFLKQVQVEKGGSIVCSLHDMNQVQEFADLVIRAHSQDPNSWEISQL